MQFTEAEVKDIARRRSNGCSVLYNKIKKELNTYNANEQEEPEPEEPPVSLIPPPFEHPIPEVIFVRKFFAWSFSIMFLLMLALVIWASITGV